MAVILSFLSDYRPSKETDYFLPSGETINGISTINGTYTNEAPVKYLIEKAKIDKPEEKTKIIFIVSKKVNDEMIFTHDYSNAQMAENGKYTGTKNMFDYYRNILENVELEYICYDFVEDSIIENSKKIANNLYQNISRKIENEKSVYIDYTGGFRDTSYLMVSLIQYLKIVGVDCKCIVYSNFQNKTIYKINYIYRINEILQGANDFISTGSITRLKNYFDKELKDRSPDDVDIEKLLKIKNLLTDIDSFTKAVSLGQISKLDQCKNNVGKSLTDYALDSSIEASSLSVNIFSLLLPIIKKSLHIDKDSLDYPEIVEWCVEHGYIQQAFTIYVEKMPVTYCEKCINALFETSDYRSSESEIFYTEFWDSLPSTEEETFAKKIFTEFTIPNRNGNLAPSYEHFCNYIIDESDRFTETEKKKLENLKRTLYYYLPARGFEYLGFKKERITSVTSEASEKAKSSLFSEMINNSKKLAYYLLGKGKEYEELEDAKSQLSDLERKNLTYQRKLKIAQNMTDFENLRSVMLLYLGIKIMRNHMNHAADTNGDTETEVIIKILESEKVQTNPVTDTNEIFNYDNAVSLINKGIELTKKVRDSNDLLITKQEFEKIKI